MENDNIEESYELNFRAVIEKITDFYEWNQITQNFYDSIKLEWPLLEEIITYNQIKNALLWEEETYRNLLKKLWGNLMIHQRKAFLDNLNPDQLALVKVCVPFADIQNLSYELDLPSESDLLDNVDLMDEGDLEI